MSGETDLGRLLAGMRPVLDPQHYIYAKSAAPDAVLIRQAVVTVAEDEGLTLILPAGLAREDLSPVFACRRITLTIHSSLQAVGLTAAVSAALTRAGIGCNMVAGYHHDHIFVPSDRAEEAMAVLRALSE